MRDSSHDFGRRMDRSGPVVPEERGAFGLRTYHMESAQPTCRAESGIHAKGRALGVALPAVWPISAHAELGTVKRMAGSLAATLTLLLFDTAAAIGPSYRPTTRSTVTPYVGHCFALLRTSIDVRLQAVITTFNEGLRLVCIL